MERVALDFGAYAAHLLLNGLTPEHHVGDLAMSKPAGAGVCFELGGRYHDVVAVIALHSPET